jgi:DNA-binding NarL/FixJ family response regulator
MKYSDISEYKVASENNRPAQSYRELTAAQKEAYQMNITVYKMREKQVLKIAHGMRIVDNALKCSARSYIPSDEMTSSCRDIIKILAARYELINNQIIEQIQEKFHDLKAWPLIKDKIEE